MGKRENWGSHIGAILAVAGSAIGLGNFLRFPSIVAQNGGGAVFIPYFIGLLVLGIPLSLVEWSLGREGGKSGHGCAPGIYNQLLHKPWAKYIGSIALIIPAIVGFFYMYIESILLGYTYYSLLGVFYHTPVDSIMTFFQNYTSLNLSILGIPSGAFFLILTLVINFGIVAFGVQKGIEKASKILLPLLFLISIIMFIRVLTVPDIHQGLSLLFKPNYKMLLDINVWFEAFTQIFFTLTIGFGVILTYASYTKKENDIIKGSLSALGMNEIIEVIFALIIVLPIAFVILGPSQAQTIANSGMYNIGFITMPLVLQTLPLSIIFQVLWFLLLFFAGLTSTISMIQSNVAFFTDEFNAPIKKSCFGIFVVYTLIGLICMTGFSIGIVDEMDFWGSQFLLYVSAIIMSLIFSFGLDFETAWKDLHCGSKIKLPYILKFTTKYITPVVLIVLFVIWLFNSGFSTIGLANYSLKSVVFLGFEVTQKTLVVLTRVVLLALFLFVNYLIYKSYKIKKEKEL